MNAVEFAEGHAPLFHAHIRPSRSLSQRGQTLIFCAAAVPSLAFAAIFVAQGYWPVAPFLGLDVALLALAFWVIRRRGAAFEEVIVSAEAILIRRADGLSQAEEDHLPTTWTRLERDEDPEFLAEAKQGSLEISPVSGTEVERIVTRIEQKIKAAHPDVKQVFIEAQSFAEDRRAGAQA